MCTLLYIQNINSSVLSKTVTNVNIVFVWSLTRFQIYTAPKYVTLQYYINIQKTFIILVSTTIIIVSFIIKIKKIYFFILPIKFT